MASQQRKLIYPSCPADLIHGLDNHLAETLACPHNVGRIHSLICTDQYKTLTSIFQGCMCCLISSHHIVLDCFTGAGLHKGNMLMCSCMINNVRFIGFKYIIDFSGITDRTDQYHQIQVRVFGAEFLLNVVCIVLIYIEDHQPLRCMGCDLAAELASDRSASTSHQDSFSADITENLIHIYLNRISSQEILHCHILHLAERYFSCDKLIDTWQYLHLTFGLFADV